MRSRCVRSRNLIPKSDQCDEAHADRHGRCADGRLLEPVAQRLQDPYQGTQRHKRDHDADPVQRPDFRRDLPCQPSADTTDRGVGECEYVHRTHSNQRPQA